MWRMEFIGVGWFQMRYFSLKVRMEAGLAGTGRILPVLGPSMSTTERGRLGLVECTSASNSPVAGEKEAARIMPCGIKEGLGVACGL
jgi:hypothetical protein